MGITQPAYFAAQDVFDDPAWLKGENGFMPLPRRLGRVPEPVRQVISEEVRILRERLRSVRGPKELRRLMKDPDFVTDLSDPLAPLLDRILSMVAKGSAPVSPRFAFVGAATVAGASATAESIMEIAALVGIEAPPVALTIAGSAAAIGIGAQLVEFYLTASVISNELHQAGREDVTVLRHALVATYLGDDPSGGIGLNRIATALVKRALPSFVPLAGIPISVRSAMKSQKRAMAAVKQTSDARTI